MGWRVLPCRDYRSKAAEQELSGIKGFQLTVNKCTTKERNNLLNSRTEEVGI